MAGFAYRNDGYCKRVNSLQLRRSHSMRIGTGAAGLANALRAELKTAKKDIQVHSSSRVSPSPWPTLHKS